MGVVSGTVVHFSGRCFFSRITELRLACFDADGRRGVLWPRGVGGIFLSASDRLSCQDGIRFSGRGDRVLGAWAVRFIITTLLRTLEENCRSRTEIAARCLIFAGNLNSQCHSICC